MCANTTLYPQPPGVRCHMCCRAIKTNDIEGATCLAVSIDLVYIIAPYYYLSLHNKFILHHNISYHCTKNGIEGATCLAVAIDLVFIIAPYYYLSLHNKFTLHHTISYHCTIILLIN